MIFFPLEELRESDPKSMKLSVTQHEIDTKIESWNTKQILKIETWNTKQILGKVKSLTYPNWPANQPFKKVKKHRQSNLCRELWS